MLRAGDSVLSGDQDSPKRPARARPWMRGRPSGDHAGELAPSSSFRTSDPSGRLTYPFSSSYFPEPHPSAVRRPNRLKVTKIQHSLASRIRRSGGTVLQANCRRHSGGKSKYVSSVESVTFQPPTPCDGSFVFISNPAPMIRVIGALRVHIGTINACRHDFSAGGTGNLSLKTAT